MTAAAASNATTVNTNGPVFSGMCSQPATTAPGPLRFGPRTDPIVVAHTTVLRSRPRCAGSARSVAAYRLWRFVAVTAPRSSIPTRSNGNDRTTPGDEAQNAAEGTAEVAEGQTGAPAVAGHVGGQDRRDHRRAEGLRGLRQPGQAVRTGDVPGQQGPDRDRRAEAEAADGLRGEEGSDGVPLDGDDVGGGGHQPRV